MRFTLLLALTASALLAASEAQAEVRLEATVPFDFQVGETVLPAGEYKIVHENPSTFLIIQSRSEGIGVVAQSHVAGGGPDSNDLSKLVFHRYGDFYFLSEVWTSDSNTGRVLRQTRGEKEMAERRDEAPVRVLVALR